MKVLVTGRRYPDGSPLAAPLEASTLASRLIAALPARSGVLREEAARMRPGVVYRGELERAPTVDLGDPRSAGWAPLVAAEDPDADQRLAAIAVLAAHRNAQAPLVYNGGDWSDWLDGVYRSRPQRPHHVLMLGGPEHLPFLLQSFLATEASVGRLDLDTTDQLADYAEKVVRLEKAAVPVPRDRALYFAPDLGADDATHFSRRYMVQPLLELTRDELRFTVEDLLDAEARRDALAERLATTRAALVFTAGHGMVDLEGELDQRKRVNGAICCQPRYSAFSPTADIFGAADVPDDDVPFMEGSVFFEFACYGAGTPARSTFAHWGIDEAPAINASEDFVAALPKRLLTHRRGPVAFVGHADLALLDGFNDAEEPGGAAAWHVRLEPFRHAVRELLGARRPVGLAMSMMGTRYAQLSAQLANTANRLKDGTWERTPELEAHLASMFLRRNDAQNYLVLGDPAAQVRIER